MKNLDHDIGFLFTVAILLPFMIAVEIAERIAYRADGSARW